MRGTLEGIVQLQGIVENESVPASVRLKSLVGLAMIFLTKKGILQRQENTESPFRDFYLCVTRSFLICSLLILFYSIRYFFDLKRRLSS